MLGVCTHLGCVPLKTKVISMVGFVLVMVLITMASGRIRKGPAPKNMEIPKYEFVDSNIIKIG